MGRLAFHLMPDAEASETDTSDKAAGERILPDTNPPRQSSEKLRTSLRDQPLRIDDQDVSVSLSLGLASYESGDVLFDQVARRADIALYVAKTQGRDRVEIYNPSRHGSVTASASQRR